MILMKKYGWFGLIACLMLILCAGLAAAETVRQEIIPLEMTEEDLDLENGEFCLTIEDTDKIISDGYFTAVLYMKDRYDPAQIENLKTGDRVQVNGAWYTVYKVERMEGIGYDKGESRLLVTYDILPEEEIPSYIAFDNTRDGYYIAVYDDWNPITFVTRVKIMLPLPDAFVWYDGPEEKPYSADELLELLSIPLDDGSTDCFGPYCTTVVFQDGQMTEIHSFPYPYGPEDEESNIEELDDDELADDDEPDD